MVQKHVITYCQFIIINGRSEYKTNINIIALNNTSNWCIQMIPQAVDEISSFSTGEECKRTQLCSISFSLLRIEIHGQ